MRRTGVWRTLGIDRTTDVATIRRAYGQALRAMDPDADPDGFARLRAARDQALASARHAEADAPDAPPPVPPATPVAVDPLTPPLVAGDARGTLTAHLAPAPVARIADAGPDRGDGTALSLPDLGLGAPLVEAAGGDVAVIATSTAEEARRDAAYDELFALLFDDDQPAAVEARVVALVETLLADPRLARISFRENAEGWFAGVLADAIPRSDPILERVAAFFGWTRAMGTLGLSPAATRVVERIRSVAYLTQVREPGHRDHWLWADLAGSADAKRWRALFIRAPRMQRYLTTIRHTYPDVEASFDPARVAAWEQKQAGTSGPNRWVWGVGIFLFLRVLISFSQPDDGRPIPTPVAVPAPTIVADQERDLNLALLDFADSFTLARVREGNPPFAQALAARWRAAVARKTPLETFIADTRRYLSDRFSGAILHAAYADAAALRRMDLAELDKARALGADSCVRYLDGALPIERVRGREDEHRRRRLMAAILLADPAAVPRRPGATFRVPGAVMARIMRATGMDREALAAALNLRGPAKARCDARRALLKETLALPPATGLSILRAM